LSGQGSGGGGALVLLLGLWLVAVVFVVSRLGDDQDDPAASIQPSPSPTPDLTFGIECETSDECAEPVSRAEVAGALDVALDLPPTTSDPFVDDDDNEHTQAINRVAAAGLMSGCGETQFCPDDGATRAQLAAILVRAFGIAPGGPNAFDDDDGNLFEPEINAVAAAGFSGGCGERRFCPNDPVSRQALRDLLARIVTFVPEASAAPSATP
jgi:hypothetical protein